MNSRHGTLAAILLSGAVLFASASFAANVAVAAPDGAGAAVSAPADAAAPVPAPEAVDPAALPAPEAPTGAPEPAPANDAAKDVGPPKATPFETAATVEAAKKIEGLGTRSKDTSKMSRRQADRTEQQITQDLNRASAASTGNANASSQANGGPATATP